MKKQVKIIALVVVLLLAAGGGVSIATRPLEVEAAILEPQTVSLTFTETGSYEYTRSYTVYPLVSGEIVQLAAAQGDVVQAGDLLAVVSATDYQHQINQLGSTIAGYNGQIANLQLQEQQQRDSMALTLRSLEGQLATLEAEIAHTEENAASLEAQIHIQERMVNLNLDAIQHARSYLRDMRDVGEDYEITQARQMVTAAQNSYSASLLALEQLRAGEVLPVAVWESQRLSLETQMDAISRQMENSYIGGMQQYYSAQISAANHSIAQLQEMSGRATLLAPVDGVITSLPASDQNLLLPQSPAAVLSHRPMVEVFVPVREIDGVRPGDTVELLLDRRLGTETMTGTVVDVEEEAQVMLSALGVEERKVRVLIRPEEELGIGHDLDVRFSPYTFADVLVAPKTAVFETDGGHFVWVIDGENTLAVRAVTRGSETRDGYLIDAGLEPGDMVVTDANNGDLRQGRRAVAAG